MELENKTSQSDKVIDSMTVDVGCLSSLAQVLDWGARQPAGDVLKQIVADVIVQDEYSHDVIVPWKGELVLVYGTT